MPRSAPVAPIFSTGAGKSHAARTPVRPAPSSSQKKTDLKDDLKGAVLLQPELGGTPRVYYKNIPKTFIGGTVYDPTKNEIIEAATVTLSGDASASTQTNGWGDFYFEGLEEGTYSVEIKANGKTKVFAAVSTKENSANLGDIAL